MTAGRRQFGAAGSDGSGLSQPRGGFGQAPAVPGAAMSGYGPDSGPAPFGPGAGSSPFGSGGEQAPFDAAGGPPPPQPTQEQPKRRQRTPIGFGAAFRNLRVRTKLTLIVLIPTIGLVLFGSIAMSQVITDTQLSSRAYGASELSIQAVALTRALQEELDQSALYMGSDHRSAAEALKNARTQTDTQLAALSDVRKRVKVANLGPVVQDLLDSVDKHVAKLAGERSNVDNNGTWADVSAEYGSFIGDLLALEPQVVQNGKDALLNDATAAQVAVSTNIRALENQRSTVNYYAASLDSRPGTRLTPAEVTTLFSLDAAQTDALRTIDSTLTTQQRRLYDKTVKETLTGPVSRMQQAMLTSATSGGINFGAGQNLQSWDTATGKLLAALTSVEHSYGSQMQDRARQIGVEARAAATMDATIALIVLALTIAFAIAAVRSLVGPLRRLRARALDVAYTELPNAVQRMRESTQADPTEEFTGITVDTREELGEVTEAFNSIHREAIRHAAEQAQLRRNVSTMFVNLSRRTQSLVERQLRLIDTLEGSEQDPDNLENLFQLDHLATRMRRNAENLLVLAGSDPGRRWTRPVALIDVLRAAAAEVEQYQRVVHTFVTGRDVEGRAVGDVVHLVAELLENATEFSPPETHVVVSARSMSGGAGVMIEIEDQGIGMSPEELATANERLSAQAEFDPQLSRMMGLYVVGRLAARHGIRVQIRSAPSGGVTALIHLPPEVVVDPMAQTGTDLPPMSAPANQPAMSEAATSEMPMLTGAEMSAPPEPMYPPTTSAPLPSRGLAGLTAGMGDAPRGADQAPAAIAGAAAPAPPQTTPPQMVPPQPAWPAVGASGMPAVPEVGPVPEGFLVGPGTPPEQPGAPQPQFGGGFGPGVPAHHDPNAYADPDAYAETTVFPMPGGGADTGGFDTDETLAGPVVPLLPSRDPAGHRPGPANLPGVPQGPAAPPEQPGGQDDAAAMTTQMYPLGVEHEPKPEPPQQPVDLDEDTIVPHLRDEDLPIFAELESEWFMRRDFAPPPPPPGLPFEEWGLSPEDVAPAGADEYLAEESAGAAAAAQPAAPAQPAEADAAPAAEVTDGSGRPALPVRQPGTRLGALTGSGSAPLLGAAAGATASAEPSPATAAEETVVWQSPADEGWRAASRLTEPAESKKTGAGLPIRVPMAHFVPGTAPAPPRPQGPVREPAPHPPEPRSAEAIRGMLSNYQRGLRQGREVGRHRGIDPSEAPYVNQEHA